MMGAYPQPRRGANPLWRIAGALAGVAVFAGLFVLGLVVLAVVAGLLVVGLIGWWLRAWWYRRGQPQVRPAARGGGDYIVAEYTVVERRRAPPEK